MTLEVLAAVVSPQACDPLISEGAFKTNVMTSTAASTGDLVTRGAYVNNTADFMSGSLRGSCAASACFSCLCREHAQAGAGGGYGAGVTGLGGLCAGYTDALAGQDNLRYTFLGISICTMVLLLLVRSLLLLCLRAPVDAGCGPYRRSHDR